ncbi:MAG: triose-phosphate isomerase, partial [Janthinobacterium lividum]
LVPLVCVGEPWSIRAAGGAGEYVVDQLQAALSGVAPADVSRVLVAYEPVWAIGDSGRAAAPSHIVDVLGRLRTFVADLTTGGRLGGLLYGGSVSSGNAAALLRLDDLDGLFVGRAAWTPEGFAAILAICGQVVAERGAQVSSDADVGPPSPLGHHQT